MDTPKKVLFVGQTPEIEQRLKDAGVDTGTEYTPEQQAVLMNARRPGKGLNTALALLDGAVNDNTETPTPFPAWFWDRLTKGKAAGDPPPCPRCVAPFTSWKARRQHMRSGRGRDTCA